MGINYISEINDFERWLETHHLPISSQLLWYKLMHICNRAGWSEWVTVDNLRLTASLQMTREATMIKARDKLIEAGLVEYQKGCKGTPNRYRLISLENVFKSVVESEVESVEKSVAYRAVKSEDIFKQRQRLNNNNNIPSSASNLSKKSLPPTVAEVTAYCEERQNKIDAQAFVDFYDSKGWMIGKNRMKDWKAAVRTWERNNRGGRNENKFNNFDGRKLAIDELERSLLG